MAAEFAGFDIEARGTELVAVFKYRAEDVQRSINEDGLSAPPGTKESVFDEKGLAGRVAFLQARGADASMEQCALGALRRTRFLRDLAANRENESLPERDQGAEAGGAEPAEDWIFGNKANRPGQRTRTKT
jgi:hypothetical protein